MAVTLHFKPENAQVRLQGVRWAAAVRSLAQRQWSADFGSLLARLSARFWLLWFQVASAPAVRHFHPFHSFHTRTPAGAVCNRSPRPTRPLAAHRGLPAAHRGTACHAAPHVAVLCLRAAGHSVGLGCGVWAGACGIERVAGRLQLLLNEMLMPQLPTMLPIALPLPRPPCRAERAQAMRAAVAASVVIPNDLPASTLGCALPAGQLLGSLQGCDWVPECSSMAGSVADVAGMHADCKTGCPALPQDFPRRPVVMLAPVALPLLPQRPDGRLPGAV